MSGKLGGFVEKLELAGRAREEQFFRRLDEQRIADAHRRTDREAREQARLTGLFAKLLVPVDLSAGSQFALSYAADMAALWESNLIVMYVVHHEVVAARASDHHNLRPHLMYDETESEGVPPLEEIVGQQRQTGYEALQHFVSPRLDGCDVELRVLMGHPAERIVETAQCEAVDLIVMGTHGRSGFRRWMAGSIAERVVRTASCPVLTVKDNSQSTEG